MYNKVMTAGLTLRIPRGLASRLSDLEAPLLKKTLLRREVQRRQILRLALRGFTAKQTSEALGIGYYTVRAWYSEPQFRQQVLSKVEGALAYADELFQKQSKTLHAKIAERSEKAFDKLCEMMDSPGTSDSLKFRICDSFLDRNPEASKHSAVDHTGQVDHRFSTEELALAARAAEEMNSKIPSRKVIAITGEEVAP